MDVKTTFLNGLVKEEVYIAQPLGFETHERHNHVYKLKKALYEFKKNPWDSTYSYMRSLRITHSDGYLNLCYKFEYGNLQRMRSSYLGVRGTFNKV